MTSLPNQTESAWPHRLALAVALATFPVIWMGGLVTTYEAGMAVPDWPSTYGYNLFLYPWQTWLFGPWDLFIEHGHRLLAASVGLLTILLVIAAWRGEPRRWLRYLTLIALGGVLLQGALGGMRVLMDERLLARIHACVGPAFFALTVALTAFTSGRWRSNAPPVSFAGAGKFRRMAFLTAALTYLQIVVGAHLRHQSLSASPGAFRIAVLFHLFLAAVIAAHVAMILVQAVKLPAPLRRLSRRARLLTALLVAQIALGAATWLVNYGWPAGAETYELAAAHTVLAQSQSQALVTTAHVALGSLILAVALLLALDAVRWLARESPAGPLATGSRTSTSLPIKQFRSLAGGLLS